MITASLGAPQIFPFSNLRSYFDHQSKNGPGSDKAAVVPQTTSAVDSLFRRPSNIGDIQVKTVPSSSATKYPKEQLQTNHKPDISPSLEPPASAEASPVLKYHPPIPEQVLKAPDTKPPILYGPLTEQDKTNENYQTPAVISQIPINVVGEKKYKLFGGFVPLTPSQALTSPPAASEYKPTVPYLSGVPPSQDLGTPTASYKYPEKYSTQKEQDDIEASKQSPVKITKASNHLYPKKWRPEKDKSKPTAKKNSPKTDFGKFNNLDSDSKQPKKDWALVREPQKIPAALQAASSFQKADVAFFPTQAKRKVPGIDEQVDSKLGTLLPEFLATCLPNTR